MTFRRPLAILAALSLLAGAAALRADSLTYTPDALPPRAIAITDAIRAALSLPPASQPATVPVTQPSPGRSPFFVSTTDDPRAVLAQAHNGDTVCLQAGGIYPGPLVLKAGVTLNRFGEGPAPVIATATDGIIVGMTTSLPSVSVLGIEVRPIDPKSDKRGDGIAIRGNVGTVVIDGCYVHHMAQNIVVEGNHGDVSILNTRSAFANSALKFQGQGIYSSLPKARRFVIDGCTLYHNGYTETDDPRARDTYCHAIYSQFDSCPPLITNTTAVDNASIGFMLRTGGTVRGCALSGNGIGVLALGKTTVQDTLFVGGGRWWTGTDWTGDVAISTYAELLTVGNLRILGVAGQAAPGKDPVYQVFNTVKKRMEPSGSYDLGAIMASRVYSPKPQAYKGGAMKITGPVLIQAWPGPSLSGDAKAANLPAGVTVKSGIASMPWLPAWRAKLANGTATAGEALHASGVN